MGNATAAREQRANLANGWPAVVIWALGWAALVLLDGQVDLANLAMLLVLASAVASLWLSVWASFRT